VVVFILIMRIFCCGVVIRTANESDVAAAVVLVVVAAAAVVVGVAIDDAVVGVVVGVDRIIRMHFGVYSSSVINNLIAIVTSCCKPSPQFRCHRVNCIRPRSRTTHRRGWNTLYTTSSNRT